MRGLVRTLVGIAAIALILLPVVAVLQGWIGTQRFPLRTLRIDGQVAPDNARQVRAVLAPYAGRGFFAVDLPSAQAAVSRLPWVEHAEVRKRWPDVVEVRISENRPFAYWGDSQLVSTHGTLFPRVAGLKLPAGMPHLAGDPRSVPAVLALYARSQALFNASGVAVRSLAQDPRGSWALTLGNGTQVVVGRNDAEARIARFAGIMPRLVTEQAGRVLQRADLRYTNGFALRWVDASALPKPVSTPPQDRITQEHT